MEFIQLWYVLSTRVGSIRFTNVSHIQIAANLQDGLRPSETAIEDMFIRKFIVGTFHGLVASEIIIKRQFNHIRIAGLFTRKLQSSKLYFLVGYTEELLALWLQCPVTMEIQTIEDRKETIYKYI